jgi:hypothetical protein
MGSGWVIKMKKRLFRKCLSIACMLATGLCASTVFADWSLDQSRGYKNKRFGDFPPADIDQQLQHNLIADNPVEESKSQDNSDSDTSSSYLSDTYPVQSYSEQNSQQLNYGSYDQDRNIRPRGSRHQNNRGTSFSGPWNNNGSSFSAPWGNRGSGFSTPWDNNSTSFSGPWNNKGSGFSAPWGNNGSSFSPWGGRGGW